jgi:hypothetical protein
MYWVTRLWRRSLVWNKWSRWLHLVDRVIHIQLSNKQDKFGWSLSRSGCFTVKSMYLDLMNGHAKYLRKYIWKIKVPLKIKIFMWFRHHKVLLTKNNLVKRSWQGNKSCSFCHKDETIQHLFFKCPFAKNNLVYNSYDVWSLASGECYESFWKLTCWYFEERFD